MLLIALPMPILPWDTLSMAGDPFSSLLPCEMGGEAFGFHLLLSIEQEVTMKD